MSVHAPLSHWAASEKIFPNSIPLDVIEIAVPIGLPERRVFLYQEVLQSGTASFAMNGVIETFRDGVSRGEFPARLCDISTDTAARQSVPTLFNGGGSPVGDSLVVQLALPFTVDTQSVVLQPFRINCEIDKIRFRLVSLAGSTLVGWRAYLACVSTKY